MGPGRVTTALPARGGFKTCWEMGTIPICSEEWRKFGTAPTGFGGWGGGRFVPVGAIFGLDFAEHDLADAKMRIK